MRSREQPRLRDDRRAADTRRVTTLRPDDRSRSASTASRSAPTTAAWFSRAQHHDDIPQTQRWFTYLSAAIRARNAGERGPRSRRPPPASLPLPSSTPRATPHPCPRSGWRDDVVRAPLEHASARCTNRPRRRMADGLGRSPEARERGADGHAHARARSAPASPRASAPAEPGACSSEPQPAHRARRTAGSCPRTCSSATFELVHRVGRWSWSAAPRCTAAPTRAACDDHVVVHGRQCLISGRAAH